MAGSKLGEIPGTTGGTVGVIAAGNTGQSAGDTAVKLGTTVATLSVSDDAALVKMATGIGGTENAKVTVFGSGRVLAATLETSNINAINGAALYATGGGKLLIKGAAKLLTEDLSAAGDTSVYIGSETSGDKGATALAISAKHTGTPETSVRIRYSGRIDQYGDITVGSPGDATVHRPCGRSAMANGASACTIYNDLVGESTLIFITLHDQVTDGTVVWAANASGHFVVNFSKPAPKTIPFSWMIKEVITSLV